VTTTEVEWDDVTRTHAMALELHRLNLHDCGLPLSVCQAAENEFEFEAEGPYRCHATTAVVKAHERLGDDVEAPRALEFVPRLRNGGRRS